MLLEGDYVQAVGSEEALNQFAVLVGEREEGELPLDQTQEIESLLLTKKDMINKQLGDLNLQRNFGCTVTRIRRSGIDLSPSPDLALKFGDKLMVVGEREGLRGVARLLGNNAKQLSDTDFFPIAMGIVLGVLFGKINYFIFRQRFLFTRIDRRSADGGIAAECRGKDRTYIVVYVRSCQSVVTSVGLIAVFG